MITVRQSNDYSMFRHHKYNRDITRTKMLEQSMRQFGFDPGLPIRVVRDGRQLVITHGHHRFEVAKRLNLPVWYIVAEQDLPLFESEASAHAWGMKDYVTARSRAGEDDAIRVMEYHELTGIPLGQCMSLLSGEQACSHNQTLRIKAGTYRVAYNPMADQIADAVMRLSEQGCSFAKKAAFVAALNKCMFVPEFDAVEWTNKAIKHPACRDNFTGTADDALQLIEDIHNYKQRSEARIPLAFMAREASLARSACKSKANNR